MTERERLIELLHDATFGVNKHTLADHLKKETVEAVADYLLANGVIVPPCNVGDTVYYPWTYDGQSGVAINKVDSINVYCKHLTIVIVDDWRSDMPMPICFDTDDFGKTVFLTREEAEKALAERSRG